MSKGRQSRATTWFKFYSENHLWGSTRSELTPDERAVWVDFLCLATMKYGEIEVFSRDQLAQQLMIDRELLDRSIDKFIEYGKIENNYDDEGKKEVFLIVNWDKYQADYLKKRQEKSNTDEDKERIEMSKESDAETTPRIEEKREEETILKEITPKEINKTASKTATSLNTEAVEDTSFSSPSPNALKEEDQSIKEAFLLKMKSIKNYSFNEQLDSMLYETLKRECPGFDILEHLDGEIAYLMHIEDIVTTADPRKGIERLLKDNYEEEIRIYNE
jgi:hypothetical protein